MKDGKGTFTASNGSKYVGRWSQDKKHGNGEMIRSDKQVFIECWNYGILISHTKKEVQEEEGKVTVGKH